MKKLEVFTDELLKYDNFLLGQKLVNELKSELKVFDINAFCNFVKSYNNFRQKCKTWYKCNIYLLYNYSITISVEVFKGYIVVLSEKDILNKESLENLDKTIEKYREIENS